MIKRFARYVLTPWLWGYSSAEHGLGRMSWSQFGEDLLIAGIFSDLREGFYVDVGAFHPLYLSNTYGLYRKGWSGIAIDANASMLEFFAKIRPRDVSIHSAVCSREGVVKITTFEQGAFNCLAEHAGNVPEQFRRGASTSDVQSKSLAKILDQNAVGHVDLLNIDCEGSDMEILESNDWARWRPSVICIEDHAEDWQSSAVAGFLEGKGYTLIYRVGLSSLYQLVTGSSVHGR